MSPPVLLKRPVAFRVLRADVRSAGETLSTTEFRLFQDEDSASEAAHALGTDYQGLYVRDGTAIVAEWQPIETAPKDGTRVLIADEDVWMAVARFWPCNMFWIEDAASGMKLNQPSHWMPIPAPPVHANHGAGR